MWMRRLLGLVSRMYLEIHPELVVSHMFLWVVGGRFCCLPGQGERHTCALAPCWFSDWRNDLSITTVRQQILSGMAFTVNRTSVNQSMGLAHCELVKTSCFNTASLHYNHVILGCCMSLCLGDIYSDILVGFYDFMWPCGWRHTL